MRPLLPSLVAALTCLATLGLTAPAESAPTAPPAAAPRTAVSVSVATPNVAATRKAGRPALAVRPATPLAATRATFSTRLPTRFQRPAVLQRKVGRSWRSLQTRRSKANGRARFSVVVLRPTAYRVLAPAVRRAGRPVPAVRSRTRQVVPRPRAELVSVTPAGRAGNGESGFPNVSATGRFVVFHSGATNLVPGQAGLTPGDLNVYLRDRVARTTTLVSATAGGLPGDGSSTRPVISRDGRYVAYASYASNLVAGDTNDRQDILRWDRVTDTTVLVSQDLVDNPANDHSYDPSISGDGSVVAYSSEATDLAFNDTNGASDVFAWRAATGNSALVSIDDGGQIADGPSYSGLVSADDEHVAFSSSATDLVAGDTNGTRDTFVRDLVDADTVLVSVSSAEVLADDYSSPGAISSDGRFVTLSSAADNLVASAADDNDFTSAYLRDTVAGTTRLLSTTRSGAAANGFSFAPGGLLDNGGLAVFLSRASNLVAGDTNGHGDIFEWKPGAPRPRLLVRDRTWGPVGDEIYENTMSADSRFVVFGTGAADLVRGDANGTSDVYLWIR